MFYSQFILAKKGPLGTIWIAAHLERKLRKNQVAETDIGVTVDNILFPEVPIALRLSGHLLLGVVRIYSRQVNYLFNDCSETLGKIKQAFQSAAVDLPPEATTAPFHSITLPETFDFDELELALDAENPFLHSNGKYVDHHVTTREQITLQDSIDNNPYLGSSQFGLDERFGDGSYASLGLDFDEEFWASKSRSTPGASTSTPLPNKDTMVPQGAGGENEPTHMDVDDPYAAQAQQPADSDVQKGLSGGEAVRTEVYHIGSDLSSVPTASSVPSNEPAGFETDSRKDAELATSKHDISSLHAYTPRIMEACTPDLNQEYCPPAEPSTPALANETSLPMYKDGNADSAGISSPIAHGKLPDLHPALNQRNLSSDSIPRPLAVHEGSSVFPSASSVHSIRSPSPPSFQGFPLQRPSPVETNTETPLPQKTMGPKVFAAKESATFLSTPFQSIPQQATIAHQTSMTSRSQEGAAFPTGVSSSFVAFPAPLLPSIRQQDGNLPLIGNDQRAAPAPVEKNTETPSLQKAAFPTGVSSSFVAFPAPLLPSVRQQDGNLPWIGNDQRAAPAPVEKNLPSIRQQDGNLPWIGNDQRAAPTPVEKNTETPSLQKDDGKAFGVRDNAAHVSSPFKSGPQAIFAQQTSMLPACHEGAAFPTGAFSSLGAFSARPLSSLRRQDGNLPLLGNPQQAAPVEVNTEACLPQKDNGQGFAVRNNAASASTPFKSVPQVTFTQQASVTPVSHKGDVCPIGASSSLGTFLSPPPPSSCQLDGNSPLIGNNQRAGPVKVYTEALVPQKDNRQGFAVRENAAYVSTSFQSALQMASAQQTSSTPVSNEGAAFSTGASTFLAPPLPLSRQQGGNSPLAGNHQQAATVDKYTEAFLPQKDNGQAFAVQEIAAFSSSPSQSFPQLTVAQQTRVTPLPHAGPTFQTGPSSSSVASSAPPLTSSFQQEGSLPLIGNHQRIGVVNQEINHQFQNQGIAVRPQNPVSSFGLMAESSPPNTSQNSIGNQLLASKFATQPNISPFPSVSSGSFFPVESERSLPRMEKTVLDRVPVHDTQTLAAPKVPLYQQSTSLPMSFSSSAALQGAIPSMSMGEYETPRSSFAAQQANVSSSAAMPRTTSSVSMGECETLRSAYNLQTGSSDFLLYHKDSSAKRISEPELEKNKVFNADTDRLTKAIFPALDKTPILREETPHMFTRPPFFPTHSVDPVPADDDLLASILGGRNKAFKVVSTPKEPDDPKINVAKRAKRAPRATPKKRKIEFDSMAVLHGDIIRQQLANANDIRRERCKAPCTRREVWGFIRECEGQENFDEPTLPELSPDLHDLYHDVLHGRELRPVSSAALTEAIKKAKQIPEALPTSNGESDYPADGVIVVDNPADGVIAVDNSFDSRGNSDRLADRANNFSMTDGLMNEIVGGGENILSENFEEQGKKFMTVGTAHTNAFEVSTETGNIEKLNVPEVSKPEVDIEGLVRHGQDSNALGRSPGPEYYLSRGSIQRETEGIEQADQVTRVDREVEGIGLAQNSALASGLSDSVVSSVSAVGAAAGDEETTTSMHTDVVHVVGTDLHNRELNTEGSEGKQQLTSEAHGQDAQEWEIIARGKEADIKTLEGNDAAELPIIAVTNALQALTVASSESKELTEVPIKDGMNSVEALNVVPPNGKLVTEVPTTDGMNALEAPTAVPSEVNDATKVPTITEGTNAPEALVVRSEGAVVTEVPTITEGTNAPEALVVRSEGAVVTEVPITNGMNALEAFSVVPASDGKDVSEVLNVQVEEMVERNLEEGGDKLPTYDTSGEGTNVFRDDEEMAAMEGERDTDLPEDDDDVAYGEIDYSSDEQDASIQDDNGWSARSRNVGRYLKTVFQEMETSSKKLEQGPTVGLDRLLARKTKREAARMFFETLVLKTKDYIHVEQSVAYQDVRLFPRSKLLKTEF